MGRPWRSGGGGKVKAGRREGGGKGEERRGPPDAPGERSGKRHGRGAPGRRGGRCGQGAGRGAGRLAAPLPARADQPGPGFRVVRPPAVRTVRPALAGVPFRGVPACSSCVAVRPAVRSGPVRTEALPWVLRGSARCTGHCGLGETAASFPAGGGPVREANCVSRTVRRTGVSGRGRCPARRNRLRAGGHTGVHARVRVRVRAGGCTAQPNRFGALSRSAAARDLVRCGPEQPGRNAEEGGRGLLAVGFHRVLKLAECRRSSEVGTTDSRTPRPLSAQGVHGGRIRAVEVVRAGEGNTRNP